MTFTILYLLAGLLFVTMTLAGSVLKRLPLTASLLYLAVGILIGPRGLDVIDVDPLRTSLLIERLTEVAVVVSLFTAGLKLRLDWRDARWRVPLRLASISMLATVLLIAIVGVMALDMSIGAAILLGAVLAPTDPVLASDVQVSDPQDQDRLRVGLTGEAGLNDGTAFPFVMLGLGLLGHHELGTLGWRWIAVDVLWAVPVGLICGAVFGTAIGHMVLHLRRAHHLALGLEDFLTLGLIALSYGAALFLHSYGFLAVFTAGLALRRVEQQLTGDALDEVTQEMTVGRENESDAATHEKTAPVYLASAMLHFNEQLERIGEVAVVVFVGALLFAGGVPWAALWFVPLLLFVIRPLAVWIGLRGEPIVPSQARLIGWFGIRGIGSIYYLMYAIQHGLQSPIGRPLTELVLVTVAVSVLLHGVSVTPLMRHYSNRSQRTRMAQPVSGQVTAP